MSLAKTDGKVKMRKKILLILNIEVEITKNKT